ncbi:hypothetical protein ABZ312_09675 [Streptomyces sp. NPDC006207]
MRATIARPVTLDQFYDQIADTVRRLLIDETARYRAATRIVRADGTTDDQEREIPGSELRDEITTVLQVAYDQVSQFDPNVIALRWERPALHSDRLRAWRRTYTRIA